MKRLAVVLAAVGSVAISIGAAPAGALTKGQLRAKVLSLSNFPTGWSVDNSSSGGPSTLPACLQGHKEAFKHDVTVLVSYTNGQAPLLEESLETGPSVNALYVALTKKIGSCREISISIDGKAVNGTVGALSFPTVGNRSGAWALSLSSQGFTIGVDIVLFQVGPIIAGIDYLDLGTPDIGQLRAFVTEAVRKVEGKSITTPTSV